MNYYNFNWWWQKLEFQSGRAAIHWAATGGCLEIVQFCVSLDENAAADPDDVSIK